MTFDRRNLLGEEEASRLRLRRPRQIRNQKCS